MPNWVDPCPACPRKYRAIGGDGPRPCDILCIAERPGVDENRQGRVLCGKTGQEWDDLYLPLAGLDRSEVRACNTVMCWAESNKTPSDKEVMACASHHIPDEIERTNPNAIILMGASACKLVPGVKLDLMHGIPQPTSKVGDLFGWHGWLVPMYHPSIGLHESRWMKICMDDWENLRYLIGQSSFEAGNQYRFESDPALEPLQYGLFPDQGIFDPNDPQSWFTPLAVDTESHGGVPWSIQISSKPGRGVLIRANDHEAIRWFAQKTESDDEEVILHNAAHDLEVLRILGIPIRRYRDTMQEAFHLGDLPQGLKALSYRIFRHTMTSYEETVRPASIRALQTWMLEAVQVAQQDLSFVERVQLKTKVKEVVHKGELEALLTRLMRLADENGEYDPWGTDKEPRLDAFWHDPCNDWIVSHIEARVGHYPILGIGNCKMEDAIRYAVGDADWTGRVAVELERRRGEAFRIYEGDHDQ